MMTIAAARMVRNGAALFVGIGLPSAAANLARLTHAPDTVLIYESGTIGTKPTVLPLSIGDGELGRDRRRRRRRAGDVRLLAAGRPHRPRLPRRGADRQLRQHQHDGDRRLRQAEVTRLPGAGGAPEIAASCKEVLITLRQNTRAFVEKLDFVTSAGHLDGGDSRERLRLPGKGPTAVITDLGILTPDPVTKELTLTSVHLASTSRRWWRRPAGRSRSPATLRNDGAADRPRSWRCCATCRRGPPARTRDINNGRPERNGH